MRKTALVVMAAGIGQRYGAGIKQLARVGPSGELIIDYSLHDALEAGFNKIIFVIRRDIEADFREVIGERIAEKTDCEICYAFQELTDIPQGFSVPESRHKPWGTGQAVLACREFIDCPFAVINADDYYGKDALVQVHDFLVQHADETNYCMAGFILKNTLSDHGSVTRGICRVGSDGMLTEVDETRGIVKRGERAFIDGTDRELDMNAHVSMNMWGLAPEFMDILARGFEEFLACDGGDDGSEYLLPIVIDGLIREGKVSVKVLESRDRWFGITYAEDRQAVADEFTMLVARGVYPAPLW